MGSYHRYKAALGLNQNQLAQLLGASRRTGQRWTRGQSRPAAHQYQQLATLLIDKDREAAAEAAQLGGTTLEALGLAGPSKAGPAVPVFAPAPEDIVDSIVCVAAEAANVGPAVMRPALLLAFTRARKLGLSIEATEKALLAKVQAGAKPGKDAK